MTNLRLILLFVVAALAPILVAVICPLYGLSMHKVKLLLLIAEYAILLPLSGFLGWKQRKRTSDVSPTVHRISLPLLIAVLVIVLIPLAWFLNLGIYQSDEGGYLFEAHCIMAGGLFALPPPPPAIPSIVGFEHDIVYAGKWFDKFPFGWPALLSLGGFFGLEWLVNPLMGVLLLGLTYAIGRILLSPHEAGCGALLLLLSPFFTLNCLGFMSHPSGGVFIAAATLCYLCHERRLKIFWLVGMITCIGAAALIRPFTALCVAIVLGVSTAWRLRKFPRQLLLFATCSFVLGGITIWASTSANHVLVGDYFRSPYALTDDGVGISARPADLVQNAIHRTPAWLADTAVVSFPFIFLLAVYALWRRRSEPDLWILALLFVLLVVGHLVELYDSDSPIGGRYYFEGFFGIALLAAAGWRMLVQDCHWDGRFRNAAIAALFTVAIVNLALFTHWEVTLRWPTRQLAKAVYDTSPRCNLVFLIATKDFIPHRYNLNHPGSSALYLLDLDPNKRGRIARELGQNCWATLSYDPIRKDASWNLYTP